MACNELSKIWQPDVKKYNINLVGMYEFGDSAESLDLQGIVETIINNLKIGRPSVS